PRITPTLAWSGDRLFYQALVTGHTAVKSVTADGTDRMELSNGLFPASTANGKTIVFVGTTADGGLWKSVDGGQPALIAKAGSYTVITMDDRSVVYQASDSGPQTLWIQPLNSGDRIQLTKRFASQPVLSLDGKLLAFGSRDDDGRAGVWVC